MLKLFEKIYNYDSYRDRRSFNFEISPNHDCNKWLIEISANNTQLDLRIEYLRCDIFFPLTYVKIWKKTPV